MNIFLVIAVIVIIIILVFQADKKAAKNKNLSKGGLTRRFPNFVEYTKTAYTSSEPYLQFVKDDGQYLEYKFPVKGQRDIAGYYYLGLQNSFGTYAYVYAVSSQGKKINGHLIEIHKGRNDTSPEDKSIEYYERIFDKLITNMEKIKDFDRLFYGNKY